MESKYQSFALPCFLFLILFTNFASSDLSQDRAKCANQLVGLATCLPYATGDAKAPTPDCCTGLKQVLQNSKECLCILVKDRNDPSLGLKINATLALSLPDKCHAPANVSQCPALLHLPPNSPDAKVFEEFVNSGKGNNSTAAPAAGDASGRASSSNIKNDGSGKKRWLRIEMVLGLLIIVVAHILPGFVV